MIRKTRQDNKISGSPYKGLMPYTEEDAAFFFGRDSECRVITNNLLANRLTLLYGLSGAGKSSVLRAGVAYNLKEQARQKLADYKVPGYAVIVFSEWKEDPVLGLLQQVEFDLKKLYEDFDFEPMPTSRNLSEMLQLWTERINGKLLIIFDQFEEYFLYHPKEEGAGTFFDEFPKVINQTNLSVNFLIALREDELAKLEKFKGKINGLFDNYLRLDYLSQDAAREAIEKPLDEYNNLLPVDEPKINIEQALVNEVLHQLETGKVQLGERGQGRIKTEDDTPAQIRIETPYLQLVMIRIWNEEINVGSTTLRLETLEKLRGAENIVKTHLDKILKTLKSSERVLANQAFRYIVTPSGSKIAHSLTDLNDYLNLKMKWSKRRLKKVFDKLSSGEARILRPVESISGNPEDTKYEIFHDALAKALQDWRKRYKRRSFIEAFIAVTIVILIVAGVLGYRFSYYPSIRDKFVTEAKEYTAAAQPESDKRLLKEIYTYQLYNLVISSNNKLLAGYAKGVKSVQLAVYNLETGELVFERKHLTNSDTSLQLQFSPDNTKLFALVDKNLECYDLGTNQLVSTQEVFENSQYFLPIIFSPDQKLLAVADVRRISDNEYTITIKLIDLASNQVTKSTKFSITKEEYNYAREKLVFNQNNKTLVYQGYYLYSWQYGAEQTNVPIRIDQKNPNYTRIISPDLNIEGQLAESNCWFLTDLCTINLELNNVTTSNKIVKTLFKSDSSYRYNILSFSSDSTIIAVSQPGAIQLRSSDTGQELAYLVHYPVSNWNNYQGNLYLPDSVNFVFSPDNKRIVSSAYDNTLKIWNISDLDSK